MHARMRLYNNHEIITMLHNSAVCIILTPRELFEDSFTVQQVLDLLKGQKLTVQATAHLITCSLNSLAMRRRYWMHAKKGLLIRKPYPSELLSLGCTLAEMMDAVKRELVFPKPHPSRARGCTDFLHRKNLMKK